MRAQTIATATLARPVARHQEDKLPMFSKFTTALPLRFWRKVRALENGCWEWTASLYTTGYGQFGRGGHGNSRAHRVAFEALVGSIPKGFELDHVCHNDTSCLGGRGCAHRRCVNSAHLEIVTHRENTLRGVGPSALHARKTHCPQGHPYSEANTYVFVTPTATMRSCRACKPGKDRLYRLRRRASGVGE